MANRAVELDAGVGQQPDHDHMRDALLLQQEIQVGVGEAALPPMLMGDEVARLRREVRVPIAAPFATRETVALHDRLLGRVGMIPVLIVTWFPAPVRDDHHLDVRGADGAIQSAQVIKEPDLISDRLDARIDPAALGQEVVVGVDKEERGSLAVVGRLGHRLPRWPPSGRLHCL